MEEASAGPSGADTKKKTMLDQVCEAIRVLGKPRKGASVLAIKKYILNASEESEHGRLTSHFKKALAKGEEAGLLVRPSYCKNSVGATGSFLLKTEKSKTVIDKPLKLPDDKTKKKLHKPTDSEVVKKPTKPKVAKAKNPKKEEENENEDDYNSGVNFTAQSTPIKSSHTKVEPKGAKPRALKKTAKSTKKDQTDTSIKKHSSDSDLTDVKKEAVKRKNLKETSKITKNNKPGKSVTSKETEKSSRPKNEDKKKPRRILKSYNSDSVLL